MQISRLNKVQINTPANLRNLWIKKEDLDMQKPSFFIFCIIGCLLLGACVGLESKQDSLTGYSISGFVGKSPVMPAAGETVALVDARNNRRLMNVVTNFFGKFSFKGLPQGDYRLFIGKIQREVSLRGRNIRLDIDLSAPEGKMDYLGYHLKAAQQDSQPTSAAAPTGPHNPQLAQEIAGIWWGYSGSTERKIGLCPNGVYQGYTESSYSGSSYDSSGSQTMAWGAAGQGGGAGRWTISGNTQQGTVHIRYNNGNQANLQYQQLGNPGCLMFDGNKLCRSGPCN